VQRSLGSVGGLRAKGLRTRRQASMGIAQACPVGFFETICFSTLHLVAMKNVFRRKEPVEVPVNSLVNKLEAVDKNS